MMKNRRDIDKKYKWDLSVIYPDEKSFLTELDEARRLVETYPDHERTVTASARGLVSALSDMVRIEELIDKLWQYAHLTFSTDTSDNGAQAMSEKVKSLAAAAGAASWFVTPRLIALEPSVLDGWYKEEPRLLDFARLIEKNIRYKPYTLSDDAEKTVSRLEDFFGSARDVRTILSNSDIRFGTIRNSDGKREELTDTNYVPYLMSTDRRVRRSAFRKLYETYKQFGNTYATLFNAHVKERCTLAAVRGFKDSLTASTFADEVTPDIYNNLIESVVSSLPALYGYYELKREVLGLKKLHLYDIYTPLISELDREYTYEEAIDETLKTVGAFGEEYESTLRAGLTERGWVDVFPTRGKRGGAFSSGAPGTEPYILMNFTGTLDDIFTLAHEAGHSMHSYYSIKNNLPHNSSYTIFVAEVASTVNELLLAHRMINESKSDDEKLYILNQLMETYKGTLFRQTMFAEFERDMHALCESGEPLTSKVICEQYFTIVKKYFGEDVVCDEQIACEWMRIPHFYTSFYVYKYATCISAASAIVKRIETEGEEYVKKYIEFLKCGGSRSPLDSLKVAEIDMTDPHIVDGAIEDFVAACCQFKEIYAKKK